MNYRPILDSALDALKDEGKNLTVELKGRLIDYETTANNVAAKMVLGTVTKDEAETAMKQLYRGLRTDLVNAGFLAEAAALRVVQNVLVAVIGALI